MSGHTTHLIQRENPGQHGPADIEVILVERERLVAGGRALHRQMPGNIRVLVGGIIQKAHISQDNGIHTQACSAVYRALPLLPAIRLRVGVDGTEHPRASQVGIVNTLGGTFLVEVQAGKLPGIGAVSETEIHRVGAVIHRSFQGWQTTGRADEFHGILHCKNAGILPLLAQEAP